MNRNERMDLARWAMQYALKQGADQSAVSIVKQRDIEIQHRDRQLEKIQESTKNSMTINVYAKHRYSVHSTCDLKKESLGKFIGNAVAMTNYLSADSYRELPDPVLYKDRKKVELAINDPSYEQLNSDQRVAIAREIESAATSVSKQIISATAYFSDTYYETVKVNSNGFFGETFGTYFSAGAESTVEDETGKRPEDYYFATTRFYRALPDPAFLGKQASERALMKVGQKKMGSGKMSMLVENRAAGRLLNALRTPLSGRNLQQKSSFLEGMLDQKIASDVLSISDDPFLTSGLSSRLYDAEGISAKQMPIIEKGVLKMYFIDTYYGKKLGMAPTTGSPSNMTFAEGAHSMDELISRIRKGILITSFLGGNSNSTTGDYSFGLQGFYIEDGVKVMPVNEMNISGNMKDLWKQLTQVGNDPYVYTSVRCPSLLFEDIQFSGI